MQKKLYRFISFLLILVTLLLVENYNHIVHAAKDSKVDYTMLKDIETCKDESGKVRGVVYFQYPEIKGSTKAIKNINRLLANDCKEFMEKNAKSFMELTQSAIENGQFINFDTQYYNKTICKVTYNENSLISMHMKKCWYAGGVYNQADYGYTFNLKSGELLSVKDVLSNNPTTAKKKILSAAKKYLTTKNGFDKVAYDIIESYNLEDFKFYLYKKKVYICFESYELNHGASWDIISLKHKFS